MDSSLNNTSPELKEAQSLMDMINSVSLFTRQTLLRWLPELSRDMGITEERFMTMYELELQPGISLKELAASLLVTPPSLSVMINSMVEQGTVTRTTDPDDRRKIVLHLSSLGKKQLEEAENYLLEKYSSYLKNLEPADRKELSGASEDLSRAMGRILNRSNY